MTLSVSVLLSIPLSTALRISAYWRSSVRMSAILVQQTQSKSHLYCITDSVMYFTCVPTRENVISATYFSVKMRME